MIGGKFEFDLIGMKYSFVFFPKHSQFCPFSEDSLSLLLLYLLRRFLSDFHGESLSIRTENLFYFL